MLYTGIDLGTTFTAAAVASASGPPEMVSLGPTSTTIPSVVFMREDGSMATGEAALQMAGSEPDRVAREFKRRVGDPAPILIAGTPMAAHLLMGRLLRWVVDRVEERQGEEIEHTVVTHPANWGEYKRDYLRQAAERAGLQSWSPLTEPEAAAIHYASRQRIDPGETVAVYDLGGGTFDVTILRKKDDAFEFVGRPHGIENLGGMDIDQALFSHVMRQAAGDLDELDTTDPVVVTALHRLRGDAVTAKITLSSETSTSIPVILPGLHTTVRLTRTELEDMIRPTLEETIVALRQAIESSGLSAEQLSKVLLVGGSSRIPLVAQLVTDALGRPVAVDADPKHAVALGAALHARNGPGRTTRPGPDPVVIEVEAPAAATHDEQPPPTLDIPTTEVDEPADAADTPTHDEQPAPTPDTPTTEVDEPADRSLRSIRRSRWRWPVGIGAVLAVAATVTFLVTSGGGDDTPAADVASVTTVDSDGIAGLFTSLVISTEGRPLIAYQAGALGALRVAACADAACSSAEITTVDDSGTVGAFTSVALAGDGLARIAYIDGSPRQDLKFAICEDIRCEASSLLSVDIGAVASGPTATVVGAGDVPVIVYSRFQPLALLGATCGNAACTNRSGFTIDDDGAPGGLAATTAPDGTVVVAYESADGLVRVTDCPACVGGPEPTTLADIDNEADPDTDRPRSAIAMTMAPGSGPIVAYTGDPARGIQVAHCDDTACAAFTSHEIPDTRGVGGDLSLSVTPGGRALVSWYDTATSSLRLSVCAVGDCSQAATFVVDDDGDVGQHSSIAAIDGNRAVIAYHDATAGSLEVALVAIP
jgi:actin-like ATPase involved in cell morphogenesis